MASASRAAPSDDGAPDGRPDGGEGDVAKRLYVALCAEDLVAAARCVAEASDDDLLVRSPWEQRQEQPRALGPGNEVAYATRGLTAVHVLARDCHDVHLLRQVVERTPRALGEKAGMLWDGSEANQLPMHCAAWKNSSVDVLRLLLEIGGAEQLQVRDRKGRLPMHWAARENSSVDVLRLLLEIGGAE